MIEKLNINIVSDKSKVLLRELVLNENRTERIVGNILSQSEDKVKATLNKVLKEFESRHRSFNDRIMRNYENVANRITISDDISNDKKLLIGTLFSMEYTTEAAALFNPSIVRHPIQDDSEKVKYVLSLRSTGEGHISSISFREGYIHKDGRVELLPSNNFVTPPQIIERENNDSDYRVTFSDDTTLSERTLFPYSQAELGGMEDVRFVEFIENGMSTYYGTYTAYSGKKIQTNIIVTKDFKTFEVKALKGDASVDKGMALFPRKIDGKYWMVTRQDQESLFVLQSDDVYTWNGLKKIKVPQHDWEMVQLGNCGSPIETDEGWLLITHAVGPMRKYVISAMLLDKNDPKKVIGSLTEPLIEAEGEERNGYVPNVVYSCGSLKNNDDLYVPYAVSDTSCSFAKGDIAKIIGAMK